MRKPSKKWLLLLLLLIPIILFTTTGCAEKIDDAPVGRALREAGERARDLQPERKQPN